MSYRIGPGVNLDGGALVRGLPTSRELVLNPYRFIVIRYYQS
jgi:hypothetical protein